MAKDFLVELMGNPNRARLLRTFIFNASEEMRVSDVSKRAGISLQSTIHELKALEHIGIIKQSKISMSGNERTEGKKSYQKSKAPKTETAWSLNTSFKHARALVAFVNEISPAQYDEILAALRPSGKLAAVILSGVLMGDPSRPADLVVAADALNEGRLEHAVKKLELLLGREIRYAAFSTPEFRYRLTVQDRLVRDTLDFPHLVLLDRAGLL